MTLQPGRRPVPGYPDYVLIRKLGAGAFGEVWHAHGPDGLDVALKFIRLDARGRALELRSLEVMKSIRHPNLVSLFGAWHKDDWLILAMELCDRSLQARLTEALDQKLPGIPLAELLSYMSDAANGLDALNARQVQHRDVKPANLLLLDSGVKVADFGLAKALEQTVASNSGAGTVAYIAPECFKGQLTQQSDQYSLAVTYYHLLTGRLLFEGDQAQVMYAHLELEPDLSHLPQEEAGVLARALSKKPRKRWRTCETFVRELIGAAYPLVSDSFAALPGPVTPTHRDIHCAAREGDCNAVRVILAESPGRVNERDGAHRTPLDWAVQHWHWGGMRLLLDYGASDAGLLRPNQGWDKALGTLPFREREVIKLRYRIGAKVVYTHEEVAQILQLSPETVMILEAEAVEKLRGAVPSLSWLKYLESTRQTAQTPEKQDIHHAAREGNLETVKAILAERPGRKDEHDVMGRTPLAWAFAYFSRNRYSRGGHYAIMRLLIDDYGVKPTEPLLRLFELGRLRGSLKRQRDRLQQFADRLPEDLKPEKGED